MTLIDVQDGGLARNEKYDVTVGVIHMVVSINDAAPAILRGFCKKEIKRDLIRLLREQIVWEQI